MCQDPMNSLLSKLGTSPQNTTAASSCHKNAKSEPVPQALSLLPC